MQWPTAGESTQTLFFMQQVRTGQVGSSSDGYKITYSVATLNYDNYYINLRDYSNSLLSGLL